MRDKLLAFLQSLKENDLRFLVDTMHEGRKISNNPDRPYAQAGRRKKIPDALCPAKTFAVPDTVKHLDTARLEALTEAFRIWSQAGTQATQHRSRCRIWLVYLLVRYGALKLGEVLALDDCRDFDPRSGLVRVSGEHVREVKLPPDIMLELMALLDTPKLASLRGTVFRMDQGFVRRKFYERASEAGIPRVLANPSVVRHSRAVELLREGVPLAVVQSFLGHQTLNLTAQYVSFSPEDIARIVNYYIMKESGAKTSARNSFTGSVTHIRQGNILAEVELATPTGVTVVSVITQDSLKSLGLAEGSLVTATIKAPWVVLVKEEQKILASARNKFCGVITSVTQGQISAEVLVKLQDGTTLCALVTDESVKLLDLKVGDPICALVNAFAVILNVD